MTGKKFLTSGTNYYNMGMGNWCIFFSTNTIMPMWKCHEPHSTGRFNPSMPPSVHCMDSNTAGLDPPYDPGCISWFYNHRTPLSCTVDWISTPASLKG